MTRPFPPSTASPSSAASRACFSVHGLSWLAFLALGLLATLGTDGASGAEPEATRLLEFTQDFDLGGVGATDAKATLGEGGVLRIATGHVAPWPGITLRAPSGSWDLSVRARLEMEVTNRGQAPVTVYLRVDNPGADGVKNCVTGNVALAPGARGTIRVPLSETPWRLSKPLELVGMRAAPGTQGALDPARVTQLVVFVTKPQDDTTFEIGAPRALGSVSVLDADGFLPFIDELGQFIHAPWPGKARSPEALAEARKAEAEDLDAWEAPSGRNAWGGWLHGPKLEATGFFRVEKVDGKWWLVDPDGRLFWSHGVDCVRSGNNTPISHRESYFRGLPGADSPLAAFRGKGSWAPHGFYKDHSPYDTFDFGFANLYRKYGEHWETLTTELTHRRLRSWGMNTIGNWSDGRVLRLAKTPYTATMNFEARVIEGSEGYWGKFYDVFDPSFGTSLRKAAEGMKRGPAGDPWCIGFYVHNELGWGDEVSLAVASLRSSADQPAKQAFRAELEGKYESIDALNRAWGTRYASWDALLESREAPDPAKAREDLLAFSARIAGAYFRSIRDELRRVAPRQLYLGCRFAWANDVAARAAAEFCDIVSYNFYLYDVADIPPTPGVDKPMIIGEFHFGALDRGLFHTGLKPTANQEARAAAYTSYVRGALRHPSMVGTHWFQYQDQCTTGRGDGENYQIGLVDICDRPYPETIEAVREVGYSLYDYRSSGRLVSEPFGDEPTLPWEWVRENPENRRIEGGLRIRLEPGGLMGAGRDARNILVRPLPRGARSVSVAVETKYASQYEQAGLLLYRGDDDYVKLIREFVDGANWIVLVVELGARPRVAAKLALPGAVAGAPSPPVTWLGLDLDGARVVASAWSEDGKRIAVGEVEFPTDPRPRIGIFTQGGVAGADRWVRFRDFAIDTVPCGPAPAAKP